MNLFGVFSAGLMTMLMLLMIMPSSSNDSIKITVTADEHIFRKHTITKVLTKKPTPTNSTTVKVNGRETVKEFKKNIMKTLETETKTKVGNDPKRVTLKYGKDNEVIKDEKTIDDYQIKNGDTVHLSIGEFQIDVRQKEVKKYHIWMNGKETVEILKKKIQTESGIKPEKISLQYGQNDDVDVLNDKKTIDDYQIKKDDIVYLSIGEFLIIVWQFGKKNEVKGYHVWVKEEETVSILKKKIRNESGIEPEEQILKYDDTDGPVMEDDKKPLKHYGIKNYAKIFLSINFVITVTTDEHFDELLPIKTNSITVKMNGRDTVKDLKKKIIKTVENESKTKIGIGPKRLTLKHGPKDDYDILNDGKAIDYYLNEKGGTVRMSIGEFNISVQYYKSYEKYTIWMNSNETVAILKKKIANEDKNASRSRTTNIEVRHKW